MITINLHQPGRINMAIPFPSSWNELLLEELQLISMSFLTTFKNPSQVRGMLLGGLLRIRSKHINKPLPEDFFQRLDAEDAVTNGYPTLDFIFGENNLYVQPFPTLKLPGISQKMYGPEDDFNSMTCGEYEDTEVFFFKFREDPGIEPLAYIAAILFRPKNIPYIRYKDGKKISYDVEKMLKHFKKLSPQKLYTIFCWYVGCSNRLRKTFPVCFEGGSGKPDIISFTKCIHAGAGPKNGTRDNIRLMPLKEFLLDAELEAKKALELMEKFKNNGR